MLVIGVILVRMLENSIQNNSEYGHFSRGVISSANWAPKLVWFNQCYAIIFCNIFETVLKICYWTKVRLNFYPIRLQCTLSLTPEKTIKTKDFLMLKWQQRDSNPQPFSSYIFIDISYINNLVKLAKGLRVLICTVHLTVCYYHVT